MGSGDVFRTAARGEPGVWLIAGPTASGKSALALSLAVRTGAEIINADAIQLYADLDILTARPSKGDLAAAPHHLYGEVDGADGWSVGRWLRAVANLIGEIQGRGRSVILVGGTGLYFNALTRGLAEAPEIPPEARAAAQAVYDSHGEAAVRARLQILDPAAEARIMPNDRQRLVRALEVVTATGRALSAWQADTTPALAPGHWRGVVLSPLRETLYARCDRRVPLMVEVGVLDEVRRLAQRGLDPQLPVMKAVGYREFAACVAGQVALDEAIAATRQETRRYAKRQMTWFRNQTADWPRIESLDPDAQVAQAAALMGC